MPTSIHASSTVIAPDCSRTLVLAGSARSGTTWLAGVLGAPFFTRTVFEPLHPKHNPPAAPISHWYIRPGTEARDAKKILDAAFAGEIPDRWVRKLSPWRWYWGTRTLVKIVRGNLLIGWIRSTFRYPVIYIIRHPCAVVASRLRLGWFRAIDDNLNRHLAQTELVTDHLGPYVSVVRKARSPAAKLAALWCIDNLVPLRQLRENEFIFSTYEQLVNDPGELDRILSAIGLPVGRRIARAKSRIAYTTGQKSPFFHGANPISSWKRELDTQSIQEVLDTVEKFEIDIYGPETMPRDSFLAPQPPHTTSPVV